MDKDGLLGGKFHFKKLPDGSLDKTKTIYTVCKAEFNYHRSNTSLAYHLKAKYPAEMTSMAPRQSTLQECGTSGRITKPVSEKLTDSLVTRIVKNCRPVSTVENGGLREVICVASVTRIHMLYEDERAQRTNMLEQANHIALTGDHWTSVNIDNYLRVAAHFSGQGWTLQSLALTVSKTEERHYAEACANHLLDVANEWEIEEKLTTLGCRGATSIWTPALHGPLSAKNGHSLTVDLKVFKIVGHLSI